VPIAAARITLQRPGSTTFAVDTLIAIAPTATSVDLALTVTMTTATEEFLLTIRLLDPTGATVFSGGPVTVVATTSPSNVVPTEVTFQYVGVGSNAAGVRIVTQSQQLFSGSSVLLIGEAFDSAGVTIPNTPIQWASLDLQRATVPNPATGTVIAGAQRGAARITATLLTGPADTTTVAVQPLPTQIVVVSGGGQTATIGTVLADSVVLEVRAADGLPVTGVSVRLLASGGTVSPDSLGVDATGRVAFEWTLGLAAGPQATSATVVEFPSVQGTVTATATPTPATDLAIVSGDDETGPVASVLPNPLVVLATDIDGNPAANASVQWTVTLNDGTASPPVSVTDANGLAATAWTLGSLAGENEVVATLIGGTPSSADSSALPSPAAPSVTFIATGVPGPAAVLELVSGNAQAGTVGAALGQPLVARTTDLFGNLVSGTAVAFATPDGGSLAPSAATTSAAGLAQSAWTLGTVAGTQTATATSAGLAGSPLPFTATAAPGSEAAVAFQSQPTSTSVGAAIPDFVVAVVDGFGNIVPSTTASVSVAIANNPGGGTLSGTTTVSAMSGLATFTGLSIDQPGVGYTLEATILSLVPETSLGFDITSATGGVFWISPVDGNWSDGAKWSSGAPPAPSDTVYIRQDGNYTVTLDVAATVKALEMGGSVGTQIFAQPGNTLTVDSAATFGPTVVTDLSGGEVTGAGTVDILGAMSWSGGTLSGAGTTRVGPGATLTITGAGAKFLDSRTLVNQDTGVWDAAGTGALVVTNGATLHNQAGATLTLQADGALVYNGGTLPTLLNDGRLTRTTGTGVFLISTALVSTDSIGVTSGTLQLGNDGTVSAPLGVEAGGTLEFTGGTHDLSGPLTGPGNVTVSGGAVTVGGAYAVTGTTTISAGTMSVANGATATATDVVLSGGTQGGPDTLVATTSFTWSGGTLSGAGTTRVGPGATLTITGAGAKFLDSRTLTNQGTGVWDAAGTGALVVTNGATLHNQAGATLTLQADGALVYNGGTLPTLLNDGRLTRTTGTGVFTISTAVTNSDTVDLLTGTLALGSTVNHLAGAVLQGTATLDVTAVTSGPFAGDVSPGTSPGILSIVGDFAQDPVSTYNIELGGTLPGTGYDQLDVSGLATLTGTLDVTLFGGFTLSPGDRFAIIVADSIEGTFATVNLPPPPANTTIDTLYAENPGGPDTLYVVVSTIPQPPAQILFAGDSVGGAFGIFRSDPDATNRVNITSEGADFANPRWSPDRTRITYAAGGGFGVANQLHVISPDGTELAHLTSATDTSTWFPRYNPTGRHLAFECGDQFTEIDVCVVPNVDGPIPSLEGIGDGQGKVFVTDFDRTNRNTGPGEFAWDPQNPDRLAFVRDSAGTSRIYTSLFDGTDVQPLSPDFMDVGNGPLIIIGGLDWSPDGSLLVFSAADPRTFIAKLYTIPRTGGDPTQLTSGPDEDGVPLFSPDGSQIFFARNLAAGQYCSLDGWRINADGSGEVQVTDEAVCDFNTDLLGADWSPDGTEIVLTGFDGQGNLLIYAIKSTTTVATYRADRRIAGRGAAGVSVVQDIQPSWRP
ncbi:MAG: hypothetical protein OEO17_05700, partial [Gemmatimonadota bacterium]|nr:hypothetical protein [Gemmatimonadota bacterium]